MKLLLLNSLVLLLCLAAMDAAGQKIRRHSKFKKGVKSFHRAKAGYGIGYGFVGVNMELGWYYASLNAGLGFAPAKGGNDMAAGWTIGTKGYFMKPNKPLRPRMGVHYGINGVYDENGSSKSAAGVSFSAGFEHRITENICYDMDIFIPLLGTNSYRPDDTEQENGPFPSIGLGFVF